MSHDVNLTGRIHRHVLEFRVKGNRHVGRDGPGSRGPNESPHLPARKRWGDLRRIRGQRKPHPDGRTRVVLVLDLSLGQRRAAAHAPVHGLQSSEDVSPLNSLGLKSSRCYFQ